METVYSGIIIMKLKRVGFFSELRHGNPDGPSLKDSVSTQAWHPQAARIAAYLGDATVVRASPGLTTDVLREGAPVIGTLRILTDGVWAWPSDLAYFFRHYHVRLPEDFVAHMRETNWHPPTIDEETLLNLE